ncbi:Ref family recombination enhancement nuclease [Aeromonas hydrophila]|uniref:Ref family recombination enhancement nuclease n=1 Tax=Aeromonas hydrophila TaxID=644 RepID=UPI00080B5E4C|nr:Ref family recombination enhancement nuclease [Aeromonas hydrophila]
MALSKPVDFEKARQAARDAQTRAIARQRARQADPAYQSAQREKEVARLDRQRQRRLDKLADPEYQAAQRLKRDQKKEARRATSKAKPKAAPAKSTSSRGLKGRTPTASEQQVMDKLGALPCLCCLQEGRTNPVISLHHVTGRTEPGAHYRTLPLCIWHHDTPADAEARQQYQDLIPRHAKGSLGGRRAWEARFGTEIEMLLQAWRMAGLEARIPELLGPLAERAAILGFFTHPNPIV